MSTIFKHFQENNLPIWGSYAIVSEKEMAYVAKYGKRLKEVRGHFGMTQAEVSQKAGIAINSLRRYEADEREPTMNTLEEIAGAYGITFGELMWADLEKLSRVVSDRKAAEITNTILKDIDESQRKQLINSFDRLNRDGRARLVGYAQALEENDLYRLYPSTLFNTEPEDND